MMMTAKLFLTDQQKIRFICSNHTLYDAPNKLISIMDDYGISYEKFDIANESWWESVGWWQNDLFVDALEKAQVELDKEIVIKVNKLDTLKYFVRSRK